jgi:thiamine pyrophosphokinase
VSRDRSAVLLLLNGELRAPRAARAAAKTAGAVVCADGGARHAVALGLVPDAVVGDMDSLPKKLPRSWKNVRFAADRDPERSDLDKALTFARARKARRLFVAGALGGGLDHELVNWALLEDRTKGLEVVVLDRGVSRLLGPGRHRLGLKKGERFSLLAAPRARLSLSGARFGLRDEVLERGSRGLGNAATGPATLVVRSGRVWLTVDASRFRG